MISVFDIELSSQYFAAVIAILGGSMFKYANLSIRYFTVLMFCHFFFQFFAEWVDEIIGENATYYKVVLVFYLVFTYLFFININKTIFFRKYLNVVFFVGAFSIAYIYYDSFGNINLLSKSILILNVVSLIASFLFFITMLNEISHQPLVRQWRFLLVFGFFFYSLVSSGTWVTDYVANSLGLNPFMTRKVNAVIYMIQLGIFFWGLWVYRAELSNNQKLKRKDYVVE